jgi:DNA recombination-mediator protein A
MAKAKTVQHQLKIEKTELKTVAVVEEPKVAAAAVEVIEQPKAVTTSAPVVRDYKRGRTEIAGKECLYFGDLSILSDSPLAAIGLSQKPKVKNPSFDRGFELALSNVKAMSASLNLIIGGFRTNEDLPLINTCLEHGGKVVVVLPFGLYQLKFEGETKDRIVKELEDGNLLIISHCAKDEKYDVKSTRPTERNKIIADLAKMLIVVDCRSTQGVWNLTKNFFNEGKVIFVDMCPDDEIRPCEHDAIARRFGAIEVDLAEDIDKVVSGNPSI